MTVKKPKNLYHNPKVSFSSKKICPSLTASRPKNLTSNIGDSRSLPNGHHGKNYVYPLVGYICGKQKLITMARNGDMSLTKLSKKNLLVLVVIG